MRSLPLLALLLTVHAFAAVPMPPESEPWTTLTAGEFRVYSNASPNATRAIVTNLLRMREALGKVTSLDVRAPKPAYVLIFRNREAFAPYRDAIFGQQDAPVSGAFRQGREANFIILDAAAEGGVTRVVYHELTHHFLRNTIPGLPLWIDEGLAEYYSTFSVRGDEVRIGYAIPDHIVALRRRTPLIPLARFFAMDQQSPEYAGTGGQSRFYAQAWALVHYFLSGGEARRARLEEFLAAIRAGKPAAEATAALGSDYAFMEQEVRSYVRRPTMSFMTHKLLDELIVPVPEAARPAPRDELLYALGTMLAGNRGTEADGEAMLAEVVRINPSHADAQAMLGHALPGRGDRDGRESADVQSAERLYAEGKQAEAIAAMRAILAATKDKELKEHLQGVIGIHEDRAARELETAAMNDIIAAATAGKTKEAQALIDALLAKVTDEELRARLAVMRQELGVRR